ncbi:serine hydrolase domain-containing protein [Rhodohalobacter sulfatireducens]|uniref:Beta-lactamase family protein n=1 Tax=Rhodohalobacter sulfatireducens TaxID=2911366 RepID=A0ABS9KJ81_9BACT|nr:serine hydrolase domain-containing protein [Rhodohalobacter sulfatireducens]MCG2590915.1 beta-lactamase family protein [Rhodohalobacter sulfatireducens]
MPQSTEISPIETFFRKKVRKDKKIVNAYLLLHSNKTGLHLNLAEGPGENNKPNPLQPVYMASVGKLFTSVIVAILHEKGELSFEDHISHYLDSELMDGLHIYKKNNYSREIQIRHLLNQTSGLPDNFYPLFDKLLANHSLDINPRKAVEWAKKNLKPQNVPGKKSYYTDTNYHLLGLIVEKICGEPFHAVMKRLIFAPLNMMNSYMLHYSKPLKTSVYKEAGFYFDQTRLNEIKGFAGLDFSGGGVVAPMEDSLKFMKALTSYKLISENTFEIMINDKARLYPGWDYGYGIWQVRPIPILLPSKYQSWGVLGATGAFMFYHPELDAYIIGSFNHQAWQRKCVRFMFKVMDKLRKQ